MIQFNLLPDVKIAYIKAQRLKRMVTMVSIVVTGVSLFIFTSLFLLINVAQKQHLQHLTNDITEKNKQLSEMPDINKILTVQNQLESLDQAHDKKPVASRLSGYIEKLTPNNVSISKLDVKFVDNTMEISGKTDQLVNINKFVDTIKFTKYTIKDTEGDKDAFSNVVLDSFTKTETGITYTIKLAFDPVIFDTDSDVSINVPTLTTNRSATEKPAALFQESPLPKTPGESQ